MPSLKPDCVCAFQRKARTVTSFAPERSVLFSPVCRGTIAKIGHVSRIAGEGAAKFLCSEDWLAEGEGFEPPVPFQAQRFSSSTVGSEPLGKFSTLLDSSTTYQHVDSLRHDPT